jgi:hypothetical protein
MDWISGSELSRKLVTNLKSPALNKKCGLPCIAKIFHRPHNFYQNTFIKYGLKICDRGALREFGQVAPPKTLGSRILAKNA